MVLRLLSRDGCEWVRVSEAVDYKGSIFVIKNVVDAGLITC
jgi:hypothetical protein